MYCEVRCPVPVLVWFDIVVVRWSVTRGTLWAGDSDACGTVRYGTSTVPDRLSVDDSEGYSMYRTVRWRTRVMLLRFDCYSCFIVGVGVLSVCVTESVDLGCYVLLDCNCFVCGVVGSRKANGSRRMR